MEVTKSTGFMTEVSKDVSGQGQTEMDSNDSLQGVGGLERETGDGIGEFSECTVMWFLTFRHCVLTELR